jgi:hypothetical protein
VSIIITEEIFASCWADGVLPDDETIETFVQSLLSSFVGHRQRSLDGVISMWHCTTISGLEIQGAAITIDDQCAHPIEISLLFGTDKQLSDGSRVSFGLSDLPNPYGSPEHNRLINRLLASFPARLHWVYTFIRSQNNWARSVA